VRDERARISENEVLFRAVNESIDRLNETLMLRVTPLVLVCECGDDACVERLEVAEDLYQRVRADLARFVVAPGHVNRDVETVVEEGPGYCVVEKRPGVPAAIAAEFDPRS
jgi:hypothetical protein